MHWGVQVCAQQIYSSVIVSFLQRKYVPLLLQLTGSGISWRLRLQKEAEYVYRMNHSCLQYSPALAIILIERIPGGLFGFTRCMSCSQSLVQVSGKRTSVASSAPVTHFLKKGSRLNAAACSHTRKYLFPWVAEEMIGKLVHLHNLHYQKVVYQHH